MGMMRINAAFIHWQNMTFGSKAFHSVYIPQTISALSDRSQLCQRDTVYG